MHQHTDSQFRTTHEHLRFPNGDHVIVHTSPGRVQVTGMIAGEYIEYAGTARDAQEQARLLEVEAPDALWSLPTEQAHRIAAALDGAAGTAVGHDDDDRSLTDLATDPEVPSSVILERLSRLTGIPVEGGQERSERVALDDGHADVDVTGEHVEVTVKLGGRVAVGVALSPSEAESIGQALRAAAHRANVARAAHVDLEGVRTVVDLLHRADEAGVPASALVEVVR